jgi:hypothetical protein
VVAQNAVKHALLAQEVVLRGEDPGEFEFYRDQRLGELAPVGQAPPYTSPEEVGRGRPTYQEVEGRLYEEPPEGGTPNESCETNPIGSGSNVGGTPNGADAQEPACETNPIGSGASGGQVPCGTEAGTDPAEGKICETNPICDRRSLRKEDAREHILSGNLL